MVWPSGLATMHRGRRESGALTAGIDSPSSGGDGLTVRLPSISADRYAVARTVDIIEAKDVEVITDSSVRSLELYSQKPAIQATRRSHGTD